MPYHIPKQLHIGFQDREDTYTGKLSFSTYIEDKTGQLKHDQEWKKWCKEEGRIVLDNKPMKGFMFNRNKTHRSNNYYFNTKRIVFRVYHPEGYEFEIKPDNVNLILEYTDISKKEITDPCIIAFTGKTIVLLPVTSPEYKEYIRKEEKRNAKNTVLDLKKEFGYKKKNSSDILLFAGKYDFSYTLHNNNSYENIITNKNKNLKNIELFYNLNTHEYEHHKIKTLTKLEDFIILNEHREKLNLNKNTFNYTVAQIDSKEINNLSKEVILQNHNELYFYEPRSYYKNNFYAIENKNGKYFYKETICINDKILYSKKDKHEEFDPMVVTLFSKNYMYKIDIKLMNEKVYSLSQYRLLLKEIENMTEQEIIDLLLEFAH